MRDKIWKYPGKFWELVSKWKEDIVLSLPTALLEELCLVSNVELVHAPSLTWSRLITSPMSSNMEDKEGMHINPIINSFITSEISENGY